MKIELTNDNGWRGNFQGLRIHLCRGKLETFFGVADTLKKVTLTVHRSNRHMKDGRRVLLKRHGCFNSWYWSVTDIPNTPNEEDQEGTPYNFLGEVDRILDILLPSGEGFLWVKFE